MGRAPAPAEASTAEPQTRRRSWRRLLPWFSLAAGIVSATIMDRSPERAWIVAVAAGGGWIVLVVVLALFRVYAAREAAQRSKLLAAARLGAFAAKQSLIQVSLFFVLPFYWQASVHTGSQLAFLAVLAITVALASWDPIFERLLARAPTAIMLEAIASFAGLAAVLPMLGLSNRVSLWVAAAATVLTAVAVALLTSPRGRRVQALGLALAIGSVAPLGLVLGLAAAIPAAPLRLVRINIGTRLAQKTVFTHQDRFPRPPDQMVCATSIWGPLGLRDELLHVWAHEGETTDRIPLEIRGGREKGFRTWSIKRNFGHQPAGRWSCAVITASGQRLGSRTTVIAR